MVLITIFLAGCKTDSIVTDSIVTDSIVTDALEITLLNSGRIVVPEEMPIVLKNVSRNAIDASLEIAPVSTVYCYDNCNNVEYSFNETYIFVQYSDFDLFSSYHKITIQQGMFFVRQRTYPTDELLKGIIFDGIVKREEEFEMYKIDNKITRTNPLILKYFLISNGQKFTKDGKITFVIFDGTLNSLKHSKYRIIVEVKTE